MVANSLRHYLFSCQGMLKLASAFYPSIKFVQANPIEKEFPLYVSLSHVDMPHARLAKYLSVLSLAVVSILSWGIRKV